jgi:hypothetical protein
MGAQVLQAEPFAIEARLQDVLEQHPEILWLGQVIDAPPTLVTIGREVPVPSGSIDLLYLGSDGVLTVVETKLRKNQESRREVVAQILEYGSYVATWSPERVAATALRYVAAKGATVDSFADWTSETFDLPPELEFDSLVADALGAGKLRLVICVDQTPEPLRSLVTFVNRHSQFMLLVLEVTSYPVAPTKHVIVPNLFGYIPPSSSPLRPPRAWSFDRATILAAAEQKGQQAAKLVGELFDLAQELLEVRPSTGASPGLIAGVRVSGRWTNLFSVDPAGERVQFIPASVDQRLAEEGPGPYETALRGLFGNHLRIGGKGYYWSMSLEAMGGRLVEFRQIIESIAERLRAGGGA